jgi:murein L,D-transpeptidase YafK
MDGMNNMYNKSITDLISGKTVVVKLSDEELNIIKDYNIMDNTPTNRKIWTGVADFWNEFSTEEQYSIINSDIPTIKILDRMLVLWRGDVWSDDVRVQQGLQTLLDAKILTPLRIEEITNRG